MGTRIAVAVVGGALLLTAARLVVMGPAAPPATTDSGPMDADESHPPRPESSPLAPPAGADTVQRESATPQSKTWERLLHVVDEHATPIPAAEVRWRHPYPRDGSGRWGGRRSVVPPLRDSMGASARTDAHGAVTISAEAKRVEVEAEAGGRYGWASLVLDDEEPAVLTIDASNALRLRALDRAGRPVGGIPLVLREQGTGARLWRGATKARDGTVLCPRAGARPGCEIVPDLPFDDLPALPVTDADLARGTLTIKLPPGACFDVLLRGPDGAPLEAPTIVWLRSEGERKWLSERRENGRWRHPWFPLGKRVRLEAVPVDRRFAPATFDGLGPVRTGHAAEAELRFDTPDRAPLFEDVLLASLLTSDGRPLADTEVEWSLETEPRSWRMPGRTTTDGEGRLRLPYESFVAPSEPVEIVFHAPSTAEGPRQAIVDVTGRLLPGGAPLGEVTLAPASVVAAGAVRRPDGCPVAGAEVELRDGLGVIIDATVSGEDGSFTLRHPTAAPDLRVLTRAPRHRAAAPTPCAAGTTDLALTLVPAAGVAGRVRLGEHVDVQSLDLFVVQGNHRRTVTLDDDGRFEVWGFASGTCTFKVCIAGDFKPFVRIVGIPVRGGERTDDPRLAAIDLTRFLRSVTLTVLDEAGSPVRARVRVVGTSRNAALLTDEDGRATLLLRGRPLEVEVSEVPSPLSHGSRSVRRVTLENVEDDRVVVLAD